MGLLDCWRIAVPNRNSAWLLSLVSLRTDMTENDLYAMGMESPTAWAKMEELCKAFGIEYPPQYTKEQAISEPS